jgi:glycosyltransferase involved in cell wall biosynthesis
MPGSQQSVWARVSAMGDIGAALVTVVIPAFNSESMVGETVRSVLAQTHRQLQLLVIDDGSTDATAAAAEAAMRNDERGRVLRFENRGGPAARNRGLRLAEGEYIAFLDHDDLWRPEKTVKQLALFEREPGVVAVGSLMNYISDRGRRLRVSGISLVAGGDPRDPVIQDAIRRARWLPFQPSSMLYRTEIVRAAGAYDEELPGNFGEDVDLIARIAAHGLVVGVMEPLGDYRVHRAATSQTRFVEMYQVVAFIGRRHDARAAGEDLSWDEFQARFPLTRQERRVISAAGRYRASGLNAVERRYPAAMAHLLMALVDSPRYTLRRLPRTLGLFSRSGSEA